ncbi:hypothetical protein F444_08587 [Phytophthora nicotianae P1976]|uniref:Uncharacterized protein n=1 Tax=Phytophthora nicotianae P1976 TaxID=1317066 RepID=A0A081AAN1_PHYNI|nr:hypothetical protein F444_08587 [Phytophthora nicotianae P1976]
MQRLQIAQPHEQRQVGDPVPGHEEAEEREQRQQQARGVVAALGGVLLFLPVAREVRGAAELLECLEQVKSASAMPLRRMSAMRRLTRERGRVQQQIQHAHGGCA